jgi:hypothetical protein
MTLRNVFGPLAAVLSMAVLPFSLCAQSAEQRATTQVVEAVVTYGDDKLFDEQEALTDSELAFLLDSLCSLDPMPQDLIKDLKMFQRMRQMEVPEMYALIDSLFELDTVPYALINEVNLYVDQLPSFADVQASTVLAWSHSNIEPGEEVYGAWNALNPNAYGPALSQHDSVVRIQLVDEDAQCGFRIPVPPVITSRFGWRQGRPHNGIDMDLEVRDTVCSAFPGVVRFAGTCGGFGRLVVVRHYNGLETYYAHLHRLKVKSGDVVDAGDLVGLGGSSGHSTGSHLHFETRFKGIPIDPSHYIDLSSGQLYCDTLVLNRTRWSFAAYPEGTRFHTVAKGEHLSAIAAKYRTSIDLLCQFNGITKRTRLRAGQRLMVLPDSVSERIASF